MERCTKEEVAQWVAEKLPECGFSDQTQLQQISQLIVEEEMDGIAMMNATAPDWYALLQTCGIKFGQAIRLKAALTEERPAALPSRQASEAGASAPSAEEWDVVDTCSDKESDIIWLPSEDSTEEAVEETCWHITAGDVEAESSASEERGSGSDVEETCVERGRDVGTEESEVEDERQDGSEESEESGGDCVEDEGDESCDELFNDDGAEDESEAEQEQREHIVEVFLRELSRARCRAITGEVKNAFYVVAGMLLVAILAKFLGEVLPHTASESPAQLAEGFEHAEHFYSSFRYESLSPCDVSSELQDESGEEEDPLGFFWSVRESTNGRKPAGSRSRSEVVQNMNQVTEKMQKDADTCVDDLVSRHLLTDSLVDAEKLDREDLKVGLQTFRKAYNELLSAFLTHQLTKEEVVAGCKDEVKRIHALMAADLNLNISGGLIEQTARPKIPTLLAYIFMHYTMTTADQSYMGSMEETLDSNGFHQGLRTPHNIQVLAILRFFGYGEARSAERSKLVNQLIQVGMGEGKSLILGATAVVFALLDFQVRCVAYSAQLSARDWKEFRQTFIDFGVVDRIVYSKITTYAEDQVAAQGDIRKLTQRLFLGDSEGDPKLPKSYEDRREVLLVDEVDVFWGADFYGKTNDFFLSVPHPSARKVFETLWASRTTICRSISTSSHCHVGTAMITDFSARLRNDLREFEHVIESQVAMMCRAMCDYHWRDCGTAPATVSESSHGGGYKVLHAYKTAFAYLDHRNELAADERERKLDEVLTLLVPCGQFAYSNVKPYYSFGVSGTIEQLGISQRHVLTKNNFDKYTIMPSLYGKYRFLNRTGTKVVGAVRHHKEIAMAIHEKIEEGRAILVFFQDDDALTAFRQSNFGHGLPKYSILEESLADEEKDRLIKKAATTGQVTLSSAPFGRGSDFVCFDAKLQERGGLHVLQTYPSLDVGELVQIQGRTARHGNKGSYSLLLTREDVEARLGVTELHGYAELESQMHCKHLASSEEAQEQALARDSITRTYFARLLDEEFGQATKDLFKQVYNQVVPQEMLCSQHYIIILDGSWSMLVERKFNLVKEAAVDFVRVAASLPSARASRVSLILFANQSHAPHTWGSLDDLSTFTAAITSRGLGIATDFGPPLSQAMDLIDRSLDQFDRHLILFYTDGDADFPDEEARNLQALLHKHSDKVDFYAITEDRGEVLHRIAKTIHPEKTAKDRVLKNVQMKDVAGQMLESLLRRNVFNNRAYLG